MNSLRGRLFIGLAVVVVLTGLAAGGLAFRWSFDEANELQDAILLQVGALAVQKPVDANPTVPKGVDAEARVVVEELGKASNAQAETLLPSLPADLPNGLQTIFRGDHQWRVLVLDRPDRSRVAVGQSTAYRDEIARDAALRTVLPLAALIPCLMLLVAVVIGQSFRPLSRLSARLKVGNADHLATLPLDGMPIELRPFVGSINGLLERIGAVLDQQRRFVADAAHELRTPITALSLHAENLDRVVAPQGLDRLAALKAGIRRTAHLLEQLLALARYETGDPVQLSRTAFDRVVREVVADFLPHARTRNIDLGFERIEKIELHANPIALAVLVRNLIDNALRHSPDGGHVDIHLFCEADCAVLRVEDTGPGIEEAELGRVLEPFYRGSNASGDGTGLGLSIVHRIVDKLSGSIVLENVIATPRSGLRVSISLPATKLHGVKQDCDSAGSDRCLRTAASELPR